MLVHHQTLLSEGDLVGPPWGWRCFVILVIIIYIKSHCRPGWKCRWCSALLLWTGSLEMHLACHPSALRSAVQHALRCCCRAVALPARRQAD